MFCVFLPSHLPILFYSHEGCQMREMKRTEEIWTHFCELEDPLVSQPMALLTMHVLARSGLLTFCPVHRLMVPSRFPSLNLAVLLRSIFRVLSFSLSVASGEVIT